MTDASSEGWGILVLDCFCLNPISNPLLIALIEPDTLVQNQANVPSVMCHGIFVGCHKNSFLHSYSETSSWFCENSLYSYVIKGL